MTKVLPITGAMVTSSLFNVQASLKDQFDVPCNNMLTDPKN